MLDGRRHSVDVPISKTLLALRRVKSLRDPSTNSLSKFSTLVDNWETNSGDGISLKFINDYQGSGADNNNCPVLANIGYKREGENHAGDCEFHDYSAKPDSKLIMGENSDCGGNKASILVKTEQGKGSDYHGINKQEICGNKSLNERYYMDHMEKGWDLTCVTPSSNCLEGVDSCNEPIVGAMRVESMDHTPSKWKLKYRNQVKSFRVVGDVVSCVGSPCPSGGDALLESSNCSSSNDQVDMVDYAHHGCGISCCWSRTPRFVESDFLSDRDDQPFLFGEVGETLSCRQRSGKSNKDEIIPYSERPRSLSQKFRPKSFSEMVGQSVVVRSLLSAISKGRVASFYLFHGPRGTGKSSASRLFAAALNCLSLKEQRPCGVCQECILFFAGRSRDVKEIDSLRINQMNRIRSLMKYAGTPPVSSQYKVFIIDECQLLQEETWATVLSSLEHLSQHVVFVMITADLYKLPRSAVSRSQRYHFPKLKNDDIASKLGTICVEECVDFDRDALDFIAAKSNGSLRDAEMMLDQLSLLGKRITVSLAHELIGIVSDDELLNLLDLALSSDSSNTVRRARELMRSRIDPMQLISQLANLIMDILAGKCQDGDAGVQNCPRRCKSETDLQKLSHALKVLSETEKQLRTSKNQMTWLTVALLQLSSVEASFVDANNSTVYLEAAGSRGDSLMHLVSDTLEDNKFRSMGIQDSSKGTLESIWRRATGICQSNSLKNFLRKQGKLSSVCVNQGVAVVELEFSHPAYVSRAEKSWNLIASLLQSILNYNVEIRINLVPTASVAKHTKVKTSSFRFFSCSRIMRLKSQSMTAHGSDQSDYSDLASEKVLIRNKPLEACSSSSGCLSSHVCYHIREAAAAERDGKENASSCEVPTAQRSPQDNMPKEPSSQSNFFKEVRSNHGCEVFAIQEPEYQPLCFSKSLRLQKSSNNHTSSFGDEDRQRDDTNVRCCAPVFSLRKACHLKHLGQRSHLVGWVLPCTTAK